VGFSFINLFLLSSKLGAYETLQQR
jgi:hypothetical protein